MPILSITASLLAALIPILFMQGIVGRLFREFAVTLSIAVVLSAFLSLTVTPMMSARLLRPGSDKAEARPRPLAALLTRGSDALYHAYARALRWVLRYQILMLVATLATIFVSVYLYAVAPKGLFPQQDTGQILGFVEASADVSSAALKQHQERVSQVIMADPDVRQAVAYTANGPMTAANVGGLFIELKPLSTRKATADEVISRLRPKLSKLEGVRVFLQVSQDVKIGARYAKTQYQYTLQDANLEELSTWAPRMLARLKSLKELHDLASDQQAAGLQLDVDIDRDTAARLGVSTADIDDALYDAFGQRQVAVMYTQLNQYRVVLEIKPELQQSLEGLSHLYVRAASGKLVPLRALCKVKPATTPLLVNHQGQFPSITLSFNTAPGVSLGQAVEAIKRQESELGLPASIHASFQGSAQAFSATLKSIPFLILAALLIVYIALGVLYESYIHPVTILSTLPSAGVGALLALAAFKMDLNIIAIIGIILLVGIVKKNAILIIDFALAAKREQGLSAQESIYQACLLRFRPILMTTLAALVGSLPLALGHGAGSELRRPLGITIVGGLLTSQALTLFTTPVIYIYMDRLAAWLGRRGLQRAR